MIDKQVIRDFLVTLTHKNIAISDDDSLLVTKLLDSLNMVELVAFLEKQYAVAFQSEELIQENLDSINAIVKILEQKGVV